jgi:hypothetical protein
VPRPSNPRLDEAVRLYWEGVTVAAIVEATGVSTSVLYEALHLRELPMRQTHRRRPRIS